MIFLGVLGVACAVVVLIGAVWDLHVTRRGGARLRRIGDEPVQVRLDLDMPPHTLQGAPVEWATHRRAARSRRAGRPVSF